MRLIFHGILKDIVGPEARMEAATIAEAVEGFSRQHPAWPRDITIAIVGYTEEARIRSESPDEVHIMPALRGGGGKFGSIILGAAVAAVGAALFFTGVGTAVGISLMVSGTLMMVQGVIGLFMKAPKMSQAENPEDSKYLGINRNTTAARTPITMAYGRVNLHPHWLSLQSDSNKLTHGRFPATTT
jgi:predicted phage tail protein